MFYVVVFLFAIVGQVFVAFEAVVSSITCSPQAIAANGPPLCLNPSLTGLVAFNCMLFFVVMMISVCLHNTNKMFAAPLAPRHHPLDGLHSLPGIYLILSCRLQLFNRFFPLPAPHQDQERRRPRHRQGRHAPIAQHTPPRVVPLGRWL